MCSRRKITHTDSWQSLRWNYIIKNCTFAWRRQHCVKPFKKPTDGRLSTETHLILEKGTFKHGHALSVGGQTPAGFAQYDVAIDVFEDTTTASS